MREIVEDVLLKSAYSQVLRVPSFALIVHQLPLLTDLRDELAQTPSRHHRLPLPPQHHRSRRVCTSVAYGRVGTSLSCADPGLRNTWRKSEGTVALKDQRSFEEHCRGLEGQGEYRALSLGFHVLA